jgi:hypothetical protein
MLVHSFPNLLYSPHLSIALQVISYFGELPYSLMYALESPFLQLKSESAENNRLNGTNSDFNMR